MGETETGYIVSFGGDENVLKAIVMMILHLLIYQKPLSCTFYRMNFMVLNYISIKRLLVVGKVFGRQSV